MDRHIWGLEDHEDVVSVMFSQFSNLITIKIHCHFFTVYFLPNLSPWNYR